MQTPFRRLKPALQAQHLLASLAQLAHWPIWQRTQELLLSGP